MVVVLTGLTGLGCCFVPFRMRNAKQLAILQAPSVPSLIIGALRFRRRFHCLESSLKSGCQVGHDLPKAPASHIIDGFPHCPIGILGRRDQHIDGMFFWVSGGFFHVHLAQERP